MMMMMIDLFMDYITFSGVFIKFFLGGDGYKKRKISVLGCLGNLIIYFLFLVIIGMVEGGTDL